MRDPTLSPTHPHNQRLHRGSNIKRLVIYIAALALPSLAQAASAVLNLTLTGPPSTGTVCAPATGGGTGNLSGNPLTGGPLPLAAGTIMFNCVVSPVGWQGAVSLNDADLTVTGLVVPSTATTPTFSLALTANGVAQTYPAATGNTLP